MPVAYSSMEERCATNAEIGVRIFLSQQKLLDSVTVSTSVFGTGSSGSNPDPVTSESGR